MDATKRIFLEQSQIIMESLGEYRFLTTCAGKQIKTGLFSPAKIHARPQK